MDDSGPMASIFLFFVLLFVNLVFFGFGAALRELSAKDVEKKVLEKDAKARKLLSTMEEPFHFVNTLQFVVTLCNVLIGGYCFFIWKESFTAFLIKAAENVLVTLPNAVMVIEIVSAVAVILFLLYILLTFGVLLPKRIADRIPEKWAYTFVGLITFLMKLFFPFTWLINATSRSLMRLFGAYSGDVINDVTEEEILSMVNEGHEQGVLEASEAEMINNIIEFGDTQAKEIMTHRNDMVAIDSNVLLQDAISFMLEEKNSRYPVYEENIDNIIGILYMKDAMRFHMNDENTDLPIKELDGLLRDAHFVPETKNIDEVFREMQSKHLQMVIVINEYGQTEGLVTMEDILEEIVGNILDEYDEDDQYIEEKGNDEYIIDGKTPLEELEERFQISFEEEDFETLNGFLISKMEHIPEEGERFEIDVENYHFKILSVENRMIANVLVTKLADKADSVDENNDMRETKA